MSVCPLQHLSSLFRKKPRVRGEENQNTEALEMQSYLRWWHTTQLPASQVLQPCANNDSQHSHYTVSLIYVFSPCRPGWEKQKQGGKERKGEEEEEEEEGCCSGAALSTKLTWRLPGALALQQGGVGTWLQRTPALTVYLENTSQHIRERPLSPAPLFVSSPISLCINQQTELWIHFFPNNKNVKSNIRFFFFFLHH